MDQQPEEELGYKLKCRLAQFLSRANLEVIPPGTLGAGMGFEQSDDVEHHYNPATEILTIKGTVTIRVRRHETD